MTNDKKRIVWIDQLRSVAFLFVILGHVALPKSAQSLIYSFHMPLFFMISGLTVNRKKLEEVDVKQYIGHQFKHLIIPYFWMSFLMYPLWYFAFHYLSQHPLTVVQAFKGIFVGNSLIVASPSNALWFLLVLFLANIMYMFITKAAKGSEVVTFTLVILCGLIGFADRAVAQIWHLNVAFSSVVLLYIGNCFMIWYKKSDGMTKLKANRKKVLGMILLLLVIGFISHYENGRISMTANLFGNSVILFYITAIAFSGVITIVFTYVPRLRIITYIGKNTLLYVGIHIPILRIFEKAFPDVMSQYKYSIPFAFVLFFGIAPICAVFNKCFPYVCGKATVNNTIAQMVGKVLMVFSCAIVPYAKVIKRIGLWQMDVLHISVYCLGLVIISIIFVIFTQRYLPIIYLEDQK